MKLKDTSMWNKTANELSVAEAVKVNVEVAVGMIAIYALGAGCFVAFDKLQTKFRNRKSAKISKNHKK